MAYKIYVFCGTGFSIIFTSVFSDYYCLRAIVCKKQTNSEVTVSDFSQFPKYQWWLYDLQNCQISFSDLSYFLRYWGPKPSSVKLRGQSKKSKTAIFFKIHNILLQYFLEGSGIGWGSVLYKNLVFLKIFLSLRSSICFFYSYKKIY